MSETTDWKARAELLEERLREVKKDLEGERQAHADLRAKRSEDEQRFNSLLRAARAVREGERSLEREREHLGYLLSVYDDKKP